MSSFPTSRASCLPLPRRGYHPPSSPSSLPDSRPQPPGRLSRAVSRLTLSFNRSDANDLAQHWKDLLENKEGDSEDDRLLALRVAAPSLAARWVDCLLPLQRGEQYEDWDRRIRREVEAEEGRNREAAARVRQLQTMSSAVGQEELHNAEMNLYLATKALKYLRQRARWAFPSSSHIPLDRNAYPNSGPAWLQHGQNGSREGIVVDKRKRRAE